MQSVIRNVIVDYHPHRESNGLVCGDWWIGPVMLGIFADLCESTPYFNIGSLTQLLKNQCRSCPVYIHNHLDTVQQLLGYYRYNLLRCLVLDYHHKYLC